MLAVATKAFKALGDQSRIRIVLALGTGELCVCQITEFLQLAPSTVSRHLQILQEASLIDSRKKGRWVYYRAADSPEAAISGDVLADFLAGIKTDPEWSEDRLRLEDILSIDPEELCNRQKNC